MKRLISALLAFICILACVLPSYADGGPGYFIRNGTSSITTPVANQTFVFDTSTNTLFYWTGSVWYPMTPPKFNMAGVGGPGVSNDNTQGYGLGSQWFDTVGGNLYVCTSAATGAATWNVVTNRIALADITAKFTLADAGSDFVVSGLLGTLPGATRAMTTPAGVAYVSGSRITPNPGSFTYIASQDTYDYLQTNGTINHINVNNGATAPTGQPGLLIQKVVTNGSQITTVTQKAITAPVLNVGTAITVSQALNQTAANALYQPLASGAANQFLATPIGSSGSASLRTIGIADLPIITTALGGTGGTLTASNLALLVGNGTIYTNAPIPSVPLTYLRLNAAGTAFEWALVPGTGNVNANLINAGPASGASAPATYRAQVVADLPQNAVILGGNGGTIGFRQILTTPGVPTVTPTGTTGAATWTYKIVAKDASGITFTAASAAGSTSTGNATLTGGNYNALSWTAVTGAASYDVYRTVSGGTPSTLGKLANVTTNSYNDIGGAGDATTAPTAAVWIGEFWHKGNLTTDSPVTCTRCRLHIDGNTTIATALTINTELSGAPASPPNSYANGYNGSGLGAGYGGIPMPSVDNIIGGSGGGFYGAGGHGGCGGATNRGIQGGQAYNIQHQLCGSGGGSGDSGAASSSGGAGGNGGGGLIIETSGSFTLSSTGSITGIGGVGGAGASGTGAGGGGSGAGVDIRALTTATIAASGTVNLTGGAGGAAFSASDAAGGGGSSGFFAMHSTASVNNGTITMTGGAAGASGGFAAAAGATGTPLIENTVWFVRTAP